MHCTVAACRRVISIINAIRKLWSPNWQKTGMLWTFVTHAVIDVNRTNDFCVQNSRSVSTPGRSASPRYLIRFVCKDGDEGDVHLVFCLLLLLMIYNNYYYYIIIIISAYGFVLTGHKNNHNNSNNNINNNKMGNAQTTAHWFHGPEASQWPGMSPSQTLLQNHTLATLPQRQVQRRTRQRPPKSPNMMNWPARISFTQLP